MFSRKVRIYYHGMQVQCNGCYGLGHMRRDCKEERMGWKGYIETLRKSGKFEDRMFGTWLEKSNDLRDQLNGKADKDSKEKPGNADSDLRDLLNDPAKLREALTEFIATKKKKEPTRRPQHSPRRNPSPRRQQERRRGRDDSSSRDRERRRDDAESKRGRHHGQHRNQGRYHDSRRNDYRKK